MDFQLKNGDLYGDILRNVSMIEEFYDQMYKVINKTLTIYDIGNKYKSFIGSNLKDWILVNT